VPDEAALAKLPEDERYRRRDRRQAGLRPLAGTWTYWGWKGGYFTTEEDARAFYDEMRFMLATPDGAPNSRNGSTPACTGPMASTAPARATSMSTPRPAS
jgi:ribonucleotide reductase alpha subunit